jgi:hypothetical protein
MPPSARRCPDNGPGRGLDRVRCARDGAPRCWYQAALEGNMRSSWSSSWALAALCACGTPEAPVDAATLERVRAAGVTEAWVALRAPPGVDLRERPRWRKALRRRVDEVIGCAGLGDAEVLYRPQSVRALHVRVDADGLDRLARCAGVLRVGQLPELSLSTAESRSLVGADFVEEHLGLVGFGQRVVVIDSGVDYRLPDFGACEGVAAGPGCKLAFGRDFVRDRLDVLPCDCDPADLPCGPPAAQHGTNVSAIAIGSPTDAANSAAPGVPLPRKGVAWGAELIHLQVHPAVVADDPARDTWEEACRQQGLDDQAVMEALDWVADQGDSWDIAAVNLSLGGSQRFAGACTPAEVGPAADVLQDVLDAGYLVVASAGNSGDPDAVSWPACQAGVLAVAASSDAAGAACPGVAAAGAADQISPFSNGGPRVDLAAPGQSTQAGGVTSCGTSQAAPHVAGVAAVLRQADPQADAAELRAALVASRTQVLDARGGTTWSYPRLDLPWALAHLDPPYVRGCDDDADCDDGDVCDGAETCDADGFCQGSLPLSCARGETCDPGRGCLAGDGPRVFVDPDPVALAGCAWQGGVGFPAGAEVDLIFTDPTAQVAAREHVTADGAGRFDWWFGLGCAQDEAAARALAFLGRVDPFDRGFQARPARYHAEWWDGSQRATAPLDYTLDHAGACVPTCAGRTCGDDGCGGRCGDCLGTALCDSTCLAPQAPRTTVSADITGTTRWTLASSPVRVTADIEVFGQLIIEAGVEVQMANDTDLYVRSGGTLRVLGRSDLPVTITSDGEATAGAWGGIDMPSTATGELRHLELRHGGNAGYGNLGVPLLVTGTRLPAIEGLRFVRNTRDTITMRSGTYTADVRLPDIGLPWWVEDDLTINPGVTLTLDPGVILKFGTEEADLRVLGRLVADGEPDRPIVITAGADDSFGGDSDANGRQALYEGMWGGVLFEDGTLLPPSIVDDVRIRLGGSRVYGTLGDTMLLDPQAPVQLTDTVFEGNTVDTLSVMEGTWTEDAHLSIVGHAWRVDGDITINPGVTVTLDPGVVLKMDNEEDDLHVLGRLVALGTPERRVVITSMEDDAHGGDDGGDGSTRGYPGDWGGLRFEDGTLLSASSLQHTTITFGGSGVYSALDAPIELDPQAGLVTDDLRLEDNTLDAYRLQTGVWSEDAHLDRTDHAYVASSDVTINPGVTLTLDPGVVWKMEHQEDDLKVLGRLMARGTAEAPIVFTSLEDDRYAGDSGADGATQPGRGAWGGILFETGTLLPASELHAARVSYAGSGVYSALAWPIEVDARAQPLLTAVTLEQGRKDAIGVQTGSYTTAVRLDTVGLPYMISADLTVGPAATLTLAPGVVVKLEGDDTDLTIQGALVAEGRADARVVITASTDDTALGDTDHLATPPAPGDWGGIYLTGAGSRLRHAEVRYGGSGVYAANDCALNVAAQALVEDTTWVSNEDAVCQFGGAVDLGGGALSSGGRNRFAGHAVNNWAVYNHIAADVFAMNNDWGTTSATAIAAMVRDRADAAGVGLVRYEPFSVGTPPVAVADTLLTDEDRPLTAAAPGLLANDASRGTATARLVEPPLYGALTLRSDGGYTYVPAADRHGDDVFRYQVVDSNGTSLPVAVVIRVSSQPDAPRPGHDVWTLAEGTSLRADPPGVLGNDLEPDGEPLSAALVSAPARGAASLGADGALTWTPPADFAGTETLTYRASDSTGRSAEAWVTLVVLPAPDAPRPRDDAWALAEDSSWELPAPGVLGNDLEPEGEALRATLVSPPAVGTLALREDGGLSWSPPQDWSGVTTFVYAAVDPGGLSAQAVGTIEVTAVNDRPQVEGPGVALATPGAPGALAGWSLADVDADGPLRLTVQGQAAWGLASRSGLTVLEDSPGLLRVEGTLASLQAALEPLTATATAGVVEVVVSLDDRGQTGAGGPLVGRHTAWLVVSEPQVDTATPDGLRLQVTPLVRGQPAAGVVSGAVPGELIHLIIGRPAMPGACPPMLGGACLEVQQPRALGAARADGRGEVVIPFVVPTRAPAEVGLHAVDVAPAGSGVVSPGVVVRVR